MGQLLSLISTLPNFLSEGVRLGLDKEIAPDGTYLAYFPFGAMIERSRMTPYHKKALRRNSDKIIPVAIATFSDSEVGESAGYGGIRS